MRRELHVHEAASDGRRRGRLHGTEWRLWLLLLHRLHGLHEADGARLQRAAASSLRCEHVDQRIVTGSIVGGPHRLHQSKLRNRSGTCNE